jgi:hypothetical protein
LRSRSSFGFLTGLVQEVTLFPVDAIRWGFLGHDTGVTKLGAVNPVYAVFGHGSFLWMIWLHIPGVFLDPGLNGKRGLSNEYPMKTLSHRAVIAQSV